MIEHYLPNNNENATVLILQNFLHLNKPQMSNGCNGIWFDTKELGFFDSLRVPFIVITCPEFGGSHTKKWAFNVFATNQISAVRDSLYTGGSVCFHLLSDWVSGSGLQFTMGAFHLSFWVGWPSLYHNAYQKASFCIHICHFRFQRYIFYTLSQAFYFAG